MGRCGPNTGDQVGDATLCDQMILTWRLEPLNENYGSKILINFRMQEREGTFFNVNALRQVKVHRWARPAVPYKVERYKFPTITDTCLKNAGFRR